MADSDARVVRRQGWRTPPAQPWSRETIVLALVAAAPAVIAGIVLARQGWTPVADNATIALRAEQVLRWPPTRLGQPSTFGDGGQTFSLGPVAYWVICLPLRFGPPALLPIVLGVFNGACLAAAVALLGRYGGRALAWAATVAVLVLGWAVDPFVLADPWNPWMGVAPLVLLAVVTWLVLLGHRRYLPAVAGLGSFVVQSHFSVAAPGAVLVLVAVVATWGPPLARRDLGALRRRVDRTTVLACVAVLLVAWAMPAHQQVTGSPGNLTAIAEADTGASRGPGAAVAVVSRTVGAPPSFVRRPTSFSVENRRAVADARPVDVAVTVIVVALLAVVVVAARRRRDRLDVAGVVVVGSLLVSVAATAWLLPADRSDTWGYATRWTAVVGIATALVLGLAAGRRLPASSRLVPGTNRDVVARVGLVGLVLVALLMRPHNPDRGLYDGADEMAEKLDEVLEPGGAYRVGWVDARGAALASLAVRAIVRADAHPRLEEPYAGVLGDTYGLDGDHCDGIVLMGEPEDHRNPDSRAVLTTLFVADDGEETWVSVAVLPDDTRSGSC